MDWIPGAVTPQLAQYAQQCGCRCDAAFRHDRQCVLAAGKVMIGMPVDPHSPVMAKLQCPEPQWLSVSGALHGPIAHSTIQKNGLRCTQQLFARSPPAQSSVLCPCARHCQAITGVPHAAARCALACKVDGRDPIGSAGSLEQAQVCASWRIRVWAPLVWWERWGGHAALLFRISP
jgi:hypothetical protein